MIFVDSDVFLIDLRYPRDRRFSANGRFLERLRGRGDGVTTIFNLLEVCGVLSFNLNARQLRELYTYFPTRYGVGIAPAHGPNPPLPQLYVSAILRVMEVKASLGDALIIALLKVLRPVPDSVVTWNADHFRGRVDPPVLTPAQALRAR